MNKNLVAILLTGLLTTGLLHAQTDQYQFLRLDIGQGLSHNQVNSIFRDSKGFLWFGTMSGLNRYDGYTFKVFKHDLRDSTSINDDNVTRIYEGPGKKLWVETSSGWNIFDPATERFDRRAAQHLAKLSLPAASITQIVKDRKGNYWFVLASGVFKYDAASGRAVPVYRPPDSKGTQPSITAFGEDAQGNFWLVHNDGLLIRMDGQDHTRLFKTDLLAKAMNNEILTYSLFIDQENELWIFMVGELRGVFHFDPAAGKLDHITKETGPYRLNTNLVMGILQDNKGHIWICTDHGGINVLTKGQPKMQYLLNNTDDNKSISQNSITTLYKDDAGMIWLGTYKKGICYYHEHIIKFPLYRHQPSAANSLPYDDVNRFVEDSKGNLWIGTNGGGLVYYNRQTHHFTRYVHDPANPRSLSNNVIVSLWIDHQQQLWIGTYLGGLDRFDGKQFIHYKHDPADPNSLSDNRIWEIYEDSRKDLWVGTLNGGINLLDRKRNMFRHYRTTGTPALHANYISAITEDKEGNLWLGTTAGIDVLTNMGTPGGFKVTQFKNIPNDPKSLSNNHVMAILHNQQGMIWVGTRDGLNLFDPQRKTFQSFRTGDGLPHNTILTLLPGKHGQFWASTPNGISNIRPRYDAVTKTVAIDCRNYDETDGLQGNAFNENAALRTSKGELIFGGANGFNVFNPNDILSDDQLPRLAFTDLKIFNKSVGIGEKINGRLVLPQSITETQNITLTYNENVLSLEFAALNFSNTERTKYAYILEGFNDQWIHTDGKMRVATYTNLDPGEYTFRVKAATDNDVWNEKGLALTIHILPPFWKTPVAYALYVLLAAAILWISRRMVVQRARIRFRMEQQQKEAQRMHELDMMKIKFFTNVSHEFRTPLSLILTPLDKMIQQSESPAQQKQFQMIHRNARRLLNLVNQLLDFRKMESRELRLNTVNGDIIKFIKDISFSFTDIAEKKNIQFHFSSSVPQLTTAFDPDKLERILFNLISNAFKFTREHGNIEVNLHTEEKEGKPFLAIKIKDNGIGIPKEKQEQIFERFFQNDLDGSVVNQGSGIGLSITKEFVKLHQGFITVDSEMEKGSCFTVWLPVQATPAEIVKEDTNPTIPDAILSAEVILPAMNGIHHKGGQQNGTHKKTTLLLVEDNEDFRFYLKDNLRQLFTIVEAGNGKEAWQKILSHHPDLIVSDISMPEMNGIDLCRKIKQDPRTSHIPVVLLTALTGEEQQLRGLETGANDYLTKPFNFEILLSRVKNLLAQQALSRKTFSKRLEVQPAEVQQISPDEQFMQQVMEQMEKHMANPDFSVEELSRSVFMSRVAFYKKILALSGKTPIEFIRSVRLQRAASLLEKTTMTVSEIAYEVGFNNPKYFSKYFKMEFDMLPSAWAQAKRKKV